MMNLKVMTPDSLVLDKDVESIILPTKIGQVNVLSGHDLVVSVLNKGWLKYKEATEDDYKNVYIGNGCAEIMHDSVLVFVRGAAQYESEMEVRDA